MKLNIKHNNKIFLALIAFLVIAFISAAQSSDVPVQDSDGYYLIGTAAQLKWFRDQVNAGAKTLNAKLTADIDLDGSEGDQWAPIGGYRVRSDGDRYSGIFDGGGHEITGLYINNTKISYQGLFSCVDGTIKNLTVRGSVKANGNVGILCGICVGYDTTIKNITVSGSVEGEGSTGGICGFVEGVDVTITNCVNESNVTGQGGICGEENARRTTFTNCINKGSVTASYNVGGICGTSSNITTYTNCVNEGNITGAYSGGICGEAWDSTITSCVNKGNIRSGTTGGICG